MGIFESMDPLLKTFWFIALPASLVFIVQSIMTFMGVDAHDGADADFSGHLGDGHAPFQLFSLRNLINIIRNICLIFSIFFFYTFLENVGVCF